MAPLLASLDIFKRASMERLRDKSRQLTDFLARGLSQLQIPIMILTPEPETRGAQLSLVLKVDATRAKRIHDQLIAAGIVCDWREPNVVRVAPVPLYNTYKEAWMLIDVFREIFA
jgi:kynureninase